MGELIQRLPKVRGRYSQDVSLDKLTWFRVGGPAEVIYKPADIEDLCLFLKEKPKDVPFQVIGVGSNLIVRDGGIPGVTIRLGKGFNSLVLDGETVDVGAGVLDRNVAFATRDAGLSELEFLCGIPGGIGGALRMNAGCYGREMQDVLVSALIVDELGKIRRLSAQDCELSYRHCGLPTDWVFVAARLQAKHSTVEEVDQRINDLLADREKTQPIKARTGGCTFANAPDEKAWQLIDRAGCRGMQVGGAQVSQQHCNFLINTGSATAHDLETLGEQVRTKVKQETGVELCWEIQRVGQLPEPTKKARAA
ncbi:MAG: UDP-N-acetylmuramate dehydrogenase [Pseudomonadota bacterium]